MHDTFWSTLPAYRALSGALHFLSTGTEQHKIVLKPDNVQKALFAGAAEGGRSGKMVHGHMAHVRWGLLRVAAWLLHVNACLRNAWGG